MKPLSPFRELLPFGEEHLPFRCHASIRLDGHHLESRFRLSGDLSSILWPVRGFNPRRRDRLWEHTCFEIFLNPEKQEPYWEVNFSSSGDWAVYQFTGCRTAMAVEERIQNITVSLVDESAQSKEWLATLSLPDVIKTDQHLTCGLSCVIEAHDRQKTYWALSHPGAKPDFHNQESFIISIAPPLPVPPPEGGWRFRNDNN